MVCVMQCSQDSLVLLSPPSFELICFPPRTAGQLLIVRPQWNLTVVSHFALIFYRKQKLALQMLWETNIPLLQTGTGELSQLTLSRRWKPSSHGHTPPSVQRCKCHWQQCPQEDQYGRIRRSLKQITFPIIFHSCFFIFLTWHLFSHVCIHIKAANFSCFFRHISGMEMEKTFLLEKRTSRFEAANLLLLWNALNCCSYTTQPDNWLNWLITFLHRWEGNGLKGRIKFTTCKAPLGLQYTVYIICTHVCEMGEAGLGEI